MEIKARGISILWNGKELVVNGERYFATVRRLKELQDVLMDPLAVQDPDLPAYFMYRGVLLSTHEPLFKKHKIRYDITVIPPKCIGGEFVKTYGHYHPVAEHDPLTGAPLSFPEVYEILHGEALILLQDRNAEKFIFVNARAGKTVLIPPNFGHVTVNPSNKILVMANLISNRFSSDYAPVKEKRGFAWYYTINGWVKNPRYSNHPEIREARPFLPAKDIYSLFVECPKLFDFLNRPSKMDWSQII